MANLVHNFGARKRKQGANFKRATDGTPEVVGEARQQPSHESSDVQVIVVSNSLEMGFHGFHGQIRLHLLGLGAVSLCFPTDCC